MTRRERRIVAALAEALVAPEPPLPPVARTDTVDAVERLLAAGPRLNRLGLRAGLHVLGRPEAIERPGKLAAAALEPWRGVIHLAYYGDLGVLRTLGYDPAEVLARAHRAGAAT